ncbi:uncharacterized protein LOC135834500 isoform X27 [Planococcus citri]|uniref:uncharacterized protein LOC135834500 isoform X27 n=1 Tax=Planococcus citri TaxID=170843 RepID=UPI0031F9B77B
MTEMESSNVFDLIYPSPATLQEISSGAFVSALWHREVKNRPNDDFKEFLSDLDLCKNVPPNILPSPIKRIIKEYSQTFISYINEWVNFHYTKVFHFHRDDKFRILHDFYDFACDQRGYIHFLHTARRMMICDRLSNDEKFKIACMYCFEDDIRRIWPSVSENLDLNEIHFDQTPELFYWICMLRNEPDRIPNYRNDPIDVVMLRAWKSTSCHWSSMLYFWNRLSPEHRLIHTTYLSKEHPETFVRFILPTLCDHLLDKFVTMEGSINLMYVLLTHGCYKICTLPTWMYIRNRMNKNNYRHLIKLLIRSEMNDCINIFYHDFNEGYFRLDCGDKLYLCCEVWRSSPDELKRSAIKYILTRDKLFIRKRIRPDKFKDTRFLLTVLSDASFEERNAFWHKNWRNVMTDMYGTDLHRMMKLCFKDENDINLFKETYMAEYENIRAYCNTLMYRGYFRELNAFLIFCCTDTSKRKVIKRHLIQWWFFNDSLVIKERHLYSAKLMNEFINDAFDDAETAANFKTGFVSYRRIERILSECILETSECSCYDLIQFIDTLVQTEEVTVALKQEILDFMRGSLSFGDTDRFSPDDLYVILCWCLGDDDDEVTNFLRSYQYW